MNSVQVASDDDVALLRSGRRGSIGVDAGVKEFTLEVALTPDEELQRDDALELSISKDGEQLGTSVSGLTDPGCFPPRPVVKQRPDVVLYLLMDNSTSMLLPDPSTELASNSSRLQAQDRVAMLAFYDAIRRAGYGFRRLGDDMLMTDQMVMQYVVNHSTEAMAADLRNFELVADSSEENVPGKVSIHLITYGYLVDYEKFDFGQSSAQQGLDVARQLLCTQTPDRVFGNSIQNNSQWNRRGLPAPGPDDYFLADNRLSSNLYSGTEMLGALEGLDYLLTDQLQRKGHSNRSTLVHMLTDGRPERRPWWDTRVVDGHDSLVGAAIPLPKKLGGDAITTSGLIYDKDGNATYLLNNQGKMQWKSMQRSLNRSPDRLAEQASGSTAIPEVDVVAFGDATDSNFEAIHDDLFDHKTFDNSNAGWNYTRQTSAQLPAFLN